MNLQEISDAYKATGRIKSERHFNRYIKLIRYYQKLNLPKSKGLTGSSPGNSGCIRSLILSKIFFSKLLKRQLWIRR